MKILKVFDESGYYVYENIPIDYAFEVDSDKVLHIYSISHINSEEERIACFMKWDKFFIEED